jgi:hypothetical protein
MVAVESEAYKQAEAEAAERKKHKQKSVVASVPQQTGEKARDAVAALFEKSESKLAIVIENEQPLDSLFRFADSELAEKHKLKLIQ